VPARPVVLGAQPIGGPRPGLAWRSTLVTNQEFCRFLNDMSRAGLPNVLHRTTLFANEAMLHERGGRIAFFPGSGRYLARVGYEYHPAYWVSWIGAAAFARYIGCRLPLRAEIDTMTMDLPIDLETINAAYRVGDTLPVADPDIADHEIGHRVGNVQVWCIDGPTRPPVGDASMTRYLYGAAWNTPATWDDIRAVRARHLVGCSRGVGVRLVCDATTPAALRTAAIASRLHAALSALTDRSAALHDLDAVIVEALTR